MAAKSLSREFKRGTLEMVLLKLISRQPMYGYALITELEKRGGEAFRLKEGTLYPVLYRLEDAGLVETRWETRERNVPRKYYHLTNQGADALKKLANEWRLFTATVDNLLQMEEKNEPD